MKKILVVDDSADTALAVSLLLQSEGHTTEMAHNGAAALQLAAEFQPQIALLDIGLPGMSGYELAQQLRRLPGLDQIQLIAISGYGQADDRARSTQAGFQHHLVKPVDIEELLKILDRRDRNQRPDETSSLKASVG